jgi:hypothetical protein
MASIRITYQSNTSVDQQWVVTEVGGASYTAETLTIDVPSWSFVNDEGHYIECNGQVTKTENSIGIRKE